MNPYVPKSPFESAVFEILAAIRTELGTVKGEAMRAEMAAHAAANAVTSLRAIIDEFRDEIRGLAGSAEAARLEARSAARQAEHAASLVHANGAFEHHERPTDPAVPHPSSNPPRDAE